MEDVKEDGELYGGRHGGRRTEDVVLIPKKAHLGDFLGEKKCLK